jgi:mannose-6-phosphate isomerase-like protein (cupin superfamily)
MDRIEQAAAENVRVNALYGAFNPPVQFKARSAADVDAVREQWSKLESIPCHVAGRDAGKDNEFPGLGVRTLLSGENSSGRISVHDILIPRGGGLPVHCLENCDLFFHIIEGTPHVTLGSLSETSLPMTFGYVPAETTFAVLNNTAEPVRLLCIYVPAGVELGFAEAHEHWVSTGDADPATYRKILGRYGFRFDLDGPLPNDARVNLPIERMDVSVESFEDFQSLRDQWAKRPPVPRLIHDRSDCFKLPIPDGEAQVNADVVLGGEDSRGRGVFFYAEQGPLYSAPPHFQPSEEEIFFLLEGNLNLRCGSTTRQLKPGYFGFAPRGASHGFINPGPGVARMITLNSPAGHERGFESMIEFMSQPNHQAEDLVNLMQDHGWITHDTEGWGADGTQAEGYVNPYETAV